MKRSIRYGTESHELAIPSGLDAVWIEPCETAPVADGETILRTALSSPIGTPPLRELADGCRNAAILVPGQDRVAAAETYLKLLLDELNAAGVPDTSITVYLATGTHAKHTPEQISRVLGREAAARVRCVEHDCQSATALRCVGRSSRGNEAWFSSAVLDADIKILTGRIIPHYFAGFGGGRKALLPGVAGFETIVRNHRMTLAPERGICVETHACRLDDNPVHLDMLECAQMVPGRTFVLNTLLDTRHRIIAAVAGELEEAHAAGCNIARRVFSIPVDRALDGAVACAGGSPYDCNFMQAIKAMFDVRDAVRQGGPLFCVAQCPSGMKPGFLDWGAISDDDELDRAVRANYNLAGHNSILIRGLVRNHPVALWSDLPDEAVRTLGIEPVQSLSRGLEWLAERLPAGSRFGVVPFANVTHAFAAPPAGGDA